ncbi:YfjI family protein [Bifidobacterium leontopitheci]|nr:hypothetical protein [Bifidobacterium leontopitheci]
MSVAETAPRLLLPGMTHYGDDSEFWASSPRLKYIHDYALARGMNPWAVLAATLCRAAACIPPTIKTPAFRGAQSPLNMYAVTVAPSGGGKTMARKVAGEIIPDMLNATIAEPASGEGVIAMFAMRVPLPAKEAGGARGRTVLACRNMRAFVAIDEITKLGALSSRQGSTLTGTLLTAWSGGDLSNWTASEEKRLSVPDGAYSIGMCAGSQLAKLGVIVSKEDEGLPQRFLYAEAEAPAEPAGTPPPEGGFGFDVAKLRDASPSADQLDRVYNDSSVTLPIRELSYPDGVKPLVEQNAELPLKTIDAHTVLTCIRTAGILAVMEQRDGHEYEVTRDDWKRAAYIVRHSRMVRDRCIAAGAAERRRQRKKTMKERAEDGEAVATALAGDAIIEFLKRRDVTTAASAKGYGRYGTTSRTIRNGISTNYRIVCGKVLDDLVLAGRLGTVALDDRETTLYYLKQ